MHRPRKRFGQNFLRDHDVIERIVRVIDPRPDDHLVEIGPGLGAITIPLIARGADIDVIELDRDLIANLERIKVPGDSVFRIHNADALEMDTRALASDGRKLRVIGNLPYNISTPLLFHLIEQQDCIKDMHFMLQKEVVDRMAAGPGGREYGRLSVMLQYHCQVQQLFNIGPAAFNPQPKVHSSFVRLTPHAKPDIVAKDYDAFSLLVSTAFAYRRKTLRNALKGLATNESFAAAGVDPNLRAEQLQLAEFARLSVVISTDRNT